MIFHDVTVTLAGSVLSRRVHDTANLVAGAVEVFRDMLERHGPRFREPLPVEPFRHVELQWTADPAYPGCAAATFWRGSALITTSMLVSGRDPEADRASLQALQTLLYQILRRTKTEPAIGLLSLADRPLIVSVPFPAVGAAARADLGVVADMETCLAAAYFLSLGDADAS